MVYAQPRIRPGERDALSSLGFWDSRESPNPSQETGPRDSQQQKRKKPCQIVDFAVPMDHRVKIRVIPCKRTKKKKDYGTWRW